MSQVSPEGPVRRSRMTGSCPRALQLGAVAQDGAGHAVRSATALAQLEPLDLNDLDTVIAKLAVRELVLVVTDDHARFQGQEVAAAIPLLPGLLVIIAARRYDIELADPERVLDRPDEARFPGDV